MVFSVSYRAVAGVLCTCAVLGGVVLVGKGTTNYDRSPLETNHLVGNVEWGSRKEILPDVAASTIGEASFETKWKNDLNVVHVVNTDFMQHQAKLTNLANARLDLFKTFTVPSMIQQTNKQFLWLIWVDPELEDSVRREFLEVVAPLRNVVVLAAVQVPETNLRSMYGHSESSMSWLRSVVLSGDSELLADYLAASKTHLLLETVLDADDALSRSFIESVQAEASYTIGQEIDDDRAVVQTFCPEYHAEWRFYSSMEKQNDEGHLVQMSNRNFCIGSGVSLAYHVEAAARRLNACNVAVDHPDCRRRSLSSQRELQCGNGRGRDLASLGVVDDPETDSCYPLQNIPNGARSPIEDGREDSLSEEFECPAGSMLCRGRDENMEFTEDFLFDFDDIDGQTVDTVIRFQCMPTDCQTDVLFFDLIPKRFSTHPDYPHDCVEFTLDYIGVKNSTRSKLCHEFNEYRDYMVTRVRLEDMINNLTFFEYNPTTLELLKNNLPFGTKGGVHVEEFFLTFGVKEFSVCVAPSMPPTERFCRQSFRLLPEAENAGLPSVKPLEASVLLARTPTAAGMKHVVPSKDADSSKSNSVEMATYGNITNDSADVFESSQNAAWESMEANFGVNREEIKALRGRFVENMNLILMDAFNGQCTPGHSCKESTKEALGYLMDQTQKQ